MGEDLTMTIIVSFEGFSKEIKTTFKNREIWEEQTLDMKETVEMAESSKELDDDVVSIVVTDLLGL